MPPLGEVAEFFPLKTKNDVSSKGVKHTTEGIGNAFIYNSMPATRALEKQYLEKQQQGGFNNSFL